MSDQTKDETKSGNTPAASTPSEVEKIEKDSNHLTEDELGKVSGGGFSKPHADAY